MRRKTLFALFAFLLILSANAQYLSLQKTEIRKLRKLIETDTGVKAIYLGLESSAKVALLQTPNPIDTIISEGHLATDPKKIKTQKSLADMNMIYALALTYQITRQTAYKDKCIDYLIAWSLVNHGIGNPINDTKLDPLLEAYDLIKDEIPETKNETIAVWL